MDYFKHYYIQPTYIYQGVNAKIKIVANGLNPGVKNCLVVVTFTVRSCQGTVDSEMF